MKKIILLFSCAVIISSSICQDAFTSDNTIICQNAVYLRCNLAKDGQACANDTCSIFSVQVTPKKRELIQNFQATRDQGKPIVISINEKNSEVISPKWKLSSWSSKHNPVAEAFGVTYFNDNDQCIGQGSGLLNINRLLGTNKKDNDEFIKQQIYTFNQYHGPPSRSFGLISFSGDKVFDLCFKIKQSITNAQLYVELLNASTAGSPLPLNYELIYKHELN